MPLSDHNSATAVCVFRVSVQISAVRVVCSASMPGWVSPAGVRFAVEVATEARSPPFDLASATALM
jgi:hypothetical protein